jgi:hypothetical protein
VANAAAGPNSPIASELAISMAPKLRRGLRRGL